MLGWSSDCRRKHHRWHSFEIYSISKRKRLRLRAFEEVHERVRRARRRDEGCVLNGDIITVLYTNYRPYCQPTFTFDTRCPSILSSLIPIAGSENPPNASSPRSRRAHVSVATPIRDAYLYVGTKFNALSGQPTETRIRYCSIRLVQVSPVENA